MYTSLSNSINEVLSCEKMFEKLGKQKEGNAGVRYEKAEIFQKPLFSLNNILLKNAASTHVARKPTSTQ